MESLGCFPKNPLDGCSYHPLLSQQQDFNPSQYFFMTGTLGKISVCCKHPKCIYLLHLSVELYPLLLHDPYKQGSHFVVLHHEAGVTLLYGWLGQETYIYSRIWHDEQTCKLTCHAHHWNINWCYSSPAMRWKMKALFEWSKCCTVTSVTKV